MEKRKAENLAKCKMISTQKSVFDVLGVGSSVMIPVKLIYRLTCLKKLQLGMVDFCEK